MPELARAPMADVRERGMFTSLLAKEAERRQGLQKRDYAFVQGPKDFEVGPCQHCESTELQWSEFKGLVHCLACGLDDVPVSNGMLSNQTRLMQAVRAGLSIDRRHIASGRIERFDLMAGRYR